MLLYMSTITSTVYFYFLPSIIRYKTHCKVFVLEKSFISMQRKQKPLLRPQPTMSSIEKHKTLCHNSKTTTNTKSMSFFVFRTYELHIISIFVFGLSVIVIKNKIRSNTTIN